MNHRVPTSAIGSLTNVELCLPQELEAPGVLVGTVVGLLLHCQSRLVKKLAARNFKKSCVFLVHTFTVYIHVHSFYITYVYISLIYIYIFDIYIYVYISHM